MEEQRHMVKRQVIELQTSGEMRQVQLLQAEMSRLYRSDIVPLIDQCCSELSEPDRLYRIDKVEVDLGYLNPQQLAGGLGLKFSKVLREKLAEQIMAQQERPSQDGRVSRTPADLELIAHFVQTGALPWWADLADSDILSSCVERLIRDHATGFRELLGRWVVEDRYAARIANGFDQQKLGDLCALLAPMLRHRLGQGTAELVRSVVELWGQGAGTSSLNERAVWQLLLQTAGAVGVRRISFVAFLTEWLSRVGREWSLSVDTMGAALTRVRHKRPSALEGELVEAMNMLSGGVERFSRADADIPPAPFGDVVNGMLPVTPAKAGVQNQMNPHGFMDSRVRRNDSSEAFATPSKGIRGISNPQHDPSLPRSLDPSLTPSALEFNVDDLEEIYLNNAGVVIIWPFFGRFFERLALIEKREFKDYSAQQRAVGLLQYLASGQTAFPEYLLPLNKILCGMAPTDGIAFDAPVTEPEMDECDRLLRSMIDQATILREMTIEGLRGTFLLRRGVLSTRDGAWLLRVERETYDVVLDKFPWSWEWINAPWMTAPLRVEW